MLEKQNESHHHLQGIDPKRHECSAVCGSSSAGQVMTTCEAEGPGWREFTSALKWLESEGYIETYIGPDGSPMVRIAEGAENAQV
jgi:hypothetical protein